MTWTLERFSLIKLKNKKSTLGKFNRDNNLSKPNSVYIVDDLTQANLNCLNDLKASDNVEDAYSMGGKIRFILKSDTSKRITVQNPFAEKLRDC